MLLCLVYIRAGTLIFGATENLSCITCLKTTAISLQNKCDIQWICVFLITLQDMYIQVLGKKVTREDNVRVGLCQGKILCYIHKLYMHHHCHACNLLTQIQRKLILKWEVLLFWWQLSWVLERCSVQSYTYLTEQCIRTCYYCKRSIISHWDRHTCSSWWPSLKNWFLL